MEAAESANLHSVLAAQGRFIRDREERLQQITEPVPQLSSNLAQVTSHLGSTAIRPRTPKLIFAMQEKYDGDPVKCRGFLLQCQLYPSSQGELTDHNKVVIKLGLLTGKALTWASFHLGKGGASQFLALSGFYPCSAQFSITHPQVERLVIGSCLYLRGTNEWWNSLWSSVC